MKKKQNQIEATATPQTFQELFSEYLEHLDSHDPSSKVSILAGALAMKHCQNNGKMEKHLKKWMDDCFCREGIDDISSSGFGYDLEMAVRLSKEQPESLSKGIEESDNSQDSAESTIMRFYENLTDREKLIIAAFDWICTAFSDGRVDSKIRGISRGYDLNKVSDDAKFLHGVLLATQMLC